MVIASILGGFGNQLNAYVSAYSVAKYLKQPLVLDVSDYTAGYFRAYVLDMLNIPNHVKVYYPKRNGCYSSILSAPANFASICDSVVNTNELNSREELLERVVGKKNIYIQGYGGLKFCTEQERLELHDLLQIKDKGDLLEQYISVVSSVNSISVHIRRTDFVDLAWSDDGMLAYYNAAIQFFVETVDMPEFYFSRMILSGCRSSLAEGKITITYTFLVGKNRM